MGPVPTRAGIYKIGRALLCKRELDNCNAVSERCPLVKQVATMPDFARWVATYTEAMSCGVSGVTGEMCTD